MPQPRLRASAALVTLTLALATLTSCSSEAEELSFRLWDPQVATAYQQSFERFEAETGIHVETVLVPWADYAAQLRADLATGVADDVFWVNATMAADLTSTGSLRAIPMEQVRSQQEGWAPSAVHQFTFGDELWGVPQLSDPGIAIVANLDLLAAGGIHPHLAADLRWDPTSADDSLRSTARQLTMDSEGHRAGEAGFNPGTIEIFGYGVSNDLNATLLPFLGSAGAAWQDGDRFVFATPAGQDAIKYLVELINEEHVSPPASETNPPGGGDFVRDQFLQGKVALFQTGSYNLANIVENAAFAWGIMPIPEGPMGRQSPTNGIAAAADADSDSRGEQQRLLEWLGTDEAQEIIGRSGSASPAALGAQNSFKAYWALKGVDVTPMYEVLEGETVQPPQGEKYIAATNALQPVLNDVFLGRLPVRDGLIAAQEVANERVTR